MAVRRPRRKTAPRAPRTPSSIYDLLSPDQIDTEAQSTAKAQLAPRYSAVDQAEQKSNSADAARQRQIEQWTAFQQNQLNDAFNQTSGALNNLISVSQGSNQDTQNNLAAALRGSDQDAFQKMIGGSGGASNEAGLLASAADRRAAGNQFLTGLAGANIANAGAQRSLASTMGLQNTDTERRRHNAELQDFLSQRNDLAGSLADLTTQAKGAITQRELDKQNQQFQQNLASRELGLKADDQAFQQGLANRQLGLDAQKFLEQKQIDWANVGINQQQVNAQLAGIQSDIDKTKDANKKDKLKAKAQGLANATAAFAQYLTPQKGEAKPGYEQGLQGNGTVADPSDPTKRMSVYRRSYDVALRHILAVGGISRADALHLIMANSDFPSWRKRAQHELNALNHPVKTARNDTKIVGKKVAHKIGNAFK